MRYSTLAAAASAMLLGCAMCVWQWWPDSPLLSCSDGALDRHVVASIDAPMGRDNAQEWVQLAAGSDRFLVSSGDGGEHLPAIQNLGRLEARMENAIRDDILKTIGIGPTLLDDARRYVMLDLLSKGLYLTTHVNAILPVYGKMAAAGLDVVVMAPRRDEAGRDLQCVFVIDPVREAGMVAAAKDDAAGRR